jgi:chromosome segregation ATPase
LELARLHGELSATGKQAAGARATATEAERQFADWQAGLQKSQAAKIQEIDAILAVKQSAVEAAEGRLKELEARRAEHEAKTAEQTEGERKLANLRNEISVHESKRTELTGLVTALVKERGAHEAEIVSLAAERARQVTGLTELAAREQELRTTVGALQNEMDTGRKLSARRGELEQEISQKEGTLRSLEERMAQLVRREEEFTLKLQSLPETDSRLKDATKVLSLVEEQKDALERDVASLSRQREEKEREIAGLAEQGHAQHVLMQTLSKRNAWLEESVATRNRRVEAANRYIAGIDSRAAEIEAKSAAHQAELETAQAGVTRAAAELESVRNEIKAATTLKERLIAEHDEARSRLHELTKLLVDTAVRRREATEGAGSERML